MSHQDDNDSRIYNVVMNHEEQYSIWFHEKPLPDGWRNEGKSGTKQECLDYIDSVWKDLRPLSLRQKQPLSTAV